MANADRANGFRPVKTIWGSPWNAVLRPLGLGDGSSDTTLNHGDCYIGDMIKLSSGLVLPANSSDTILGVAMGFGKTPSGTMGGSDALNAGGMFNPDDLSVAGNHFRHTYTNTEWFCWYAPAEGMVFEVQTATGVTVANFDAVGDLGDVFGTADNSLGANEAHGSRTTGLSTEEIGAASNNDVKIVAIPTHPDNDRTLVNASIHVYFQATEFDIS